MAIRMLQLFCLLCLTVWFKDKCQAQKSLPNNTGPIAIHWRNQLKGAFKFQSQWQYPEGIYINNFGQVSCDANCPEAATLLKEGNGQIKTQNLERFYQLVDTAHQYYTLNSITNCDEWSGANFMDIIKAQGDSLLIKSSTNVGTHCSLAILIMNGANCWPTIELQSVATPGKIVYQLIKGKFTADETLWKRGVLKATFSFLFDNPNNPLVPIFWKGEIYKSLK